ncbi:MAG: AzlD domain-containing protein [Erysipelotrichaceae bacterium]|nr:AzlD domain-containing protein [Erysipelotrichaceae bacterium]
MNNRMYICAAIFVMAAVTLFLRVFPFILFQKGKVPSSISYLGQVLPFAIMGMLVVYCLKGVSFAAAPFGIPEIISVGLTAALQVWKRNPLLSIAAATVCYMILIRLF